VRVGCSSAVVSVAATSGANYRLYLSEYKHDGLYSVAYKYSAYCIQNIAEDTCISLRPCGDIPMESKKTNYRLYVSCVTSW
jgi:hypothetical protein